MLYLKDKDNKWLSDEVALFQVYSSMAAPIP